MPLGETLGLSLGGVGLGGKPLPPDGVGRLEAVALNQPGRVVGFAELEQRPAQLFDRVEAAEPHTRDLDVVFARSSTADFRTLELARRVVERVGPRASVAPALRWKRAMTSSRKGGTRDPQVLLDNLHLETAPSAPVVLFDDVMTTGAHMVACCRKLGLSGVPPVLGMAVGRTTLEQRPKMIEWVKEEIPIEARPSAWDWDF